MQEEIMNATTSLRSVLALAMVAAPVSALAGNLEPVPMEQSVIMAPQIDTAPDLVFTLGAGVKSTPEYFGADENTVAPAFKGRLNYARLGGLSFGSPDGVTEPEGFGLGVAFRYIGERDTSEYDELDGLDDIDATLELGLGAGYEARNFAVFADVRQGIGGHDGVVGDLGADVIFRPTDKLVLTAGPRAFFGDDTYADTYFGVSDSESTDSGYDSFDAEGGLLSTGVELGATYKFDDRWGLESSVRYDRYQNDAADSPIVERGSDDQVTAEIGFTRTFTLNF
ncbi:MipA/OmpV family protein [Roseicyclus sp. F158]|uniref:MipA/OmpV family protein n=1 Tax=Tropicimonas omnivorans TaxID=3075590 RepID=A0ABU3DLS7_9RHOB|nr:MipA/OmpV family protein [Roseicyclus sp. F158]MDT0684679.1 MipA/OmpV family protein [Roseicyclus sp. F158]